MPSTLFMDKGYKKKGLLDQIAEEFFNYLGFHLPQQCANDEFYFLPRTEAAIQHLNKLDDLSPERIQDHLGYVKNLLREIPAAKSDDLEKEIDRLLLKQSMESFIREFEDAKVWQSDPTLYVKIPLFATDQIVSQRDRTPDQVPSFLTQGIKNLRSPSEISLQVALNMAQDALDFYNRDIQAFIEEKMGEDKGLFIKIKKVLEAWERFKLDLLHLPSTESFAIGEDGLKKIFTVSLSYPKSPSEILEMAQEAYQKTQEKLLSLSRKID
jgi:predicted RNase H-like HicB family nuclease